MLSVDNYVQAGSGLQGYNRYSYALNNPLKYNDPDGEWVANAIGAVMGGISGYRLAKSNGAKGFLSYFVYIAAGVGIGAATAGFGSAIANSGIALAQTWSIIGASALNSGAMKLLSGGDSDFVVNFGVGTFNFDKNSYRGLGSKGNSTIDNIGFVFGALANLQDVVAGNKGVNVDVLARKEVAGHSEITGEDITISVGPGSYDNKFEGVTPEVSDLKWESQFILKAPKGRNTPMIDIEMHPHFSISLNNVNGKLLKTMTNNLNSGKNLLGSNNLKYGVFRGCVNYTSRALMYSGVPTINALLPITAPVLLNAELTLRQWGIYASPYMNNH